jgi:hypothetical protein
MRDDVDDDLGVDGFTGLCPMRSGGGGRAYDTGEQNRKYN